MIKPLFVLLLVAIISSTESLPTLRWRKSARSDSASPKIFTTTTVSTNQQSANPKFIDLTFLQNLPKYVLNQFKKPQQTEFLSLNSLNNRFDSNYHSYETFPNDQVITATNLKPDIKNELDIYSTNDPYEDDDVIVIPFTKQRGPAKFGNSDNKPFTGKSEQGVPGAIGYDPKEKQVIKKKSKNHLSNFKVLKDGLTDDLDTGDELPSSLSEDNEESSDLHPVYVKPPQNFQAVFYPNRLIDGVNVQNSKLANQATIRPLTTDKKQEIPYLYPNGISSWILGGDRLFQRGAYWSDLANDESLYGYGKQIKKVETDLNGNSLETSADQLNRNGKSIQLLNANQLNSLNDDNLEFIPLFDSVQPKRRSDEIDLKVKNVKKLNLIGKFKNSAPLNKAKSLKRKFNLRPKKINKVLTKANKLIDKNSKIL